MKKLPTLIQAVADSLSPIFPFTLILYLFLFLLENIFPGFISNIFDLNFFLIPIILFGILAAFTNIEEQKNEKAKKSDYILIVGLAVISLIFLFYKISDMGIVGFWISLFSSFLIVCMSVIILVFSDEEREYIKNYSIEMIVKKGSLENFLFSPIGILAIISVVIVIGVGSYFAAKQEIVAKQEIKAITPILRQYILKKNVKIDKPADEILQRTSVRVLNGTGKAGIASEMAGYLKNNDFKFVGAGDAQNSNYKNALIQFNGKDATVAAYLSFLLSQKYKIINLLPLSSSSSGIILILGN